MFLLRYRHIIVWLAIAALISFLAVYIYMTKLPEGKNNEAENVLAAHATERRIGENYEVILREAYRVCQKYGYDCIAEKIIMKAAREDLDNLNEVELQAKFPVTDGWQITWEESRVLLTHLTSGLCPEHQKRWHLRPDDTGQLVAIYLGPAKIKTEGGLISVTDISIKGLPENLQEKIFQGSMEYLEWDDLIATLDSLAE